MNEELNSYQNFEEEKRVFYVAATRAKKQLFLSASKDAGVISRFIRDFEAFLLKVKDFSESKEKIN